MHALAQLDAALAVGQRELAAYTSDDPDSVFSLVEEREGFVMGALASVPDVDAHDQPLLISKLRMLLDQQQALSSAARRLRDEVMQSLNDSKGETQRLAAYGRSVRPTLYTPSFARS